MMNANTAWLRQLDIIIHEGRSVSPRGQPTLELPQSTLTVDMRHPVITIKERSLNYRFMAAEALWILSGDDRVATISPYNSRISQFSDDGKTFFGAYGPKLVSQLPYVVNKLVEDPDTRQAGLTFWRECPPATKDVPCTIAMFFSIRSGELNCHVFMRSSDIWLGIPYDVFNFSMIAHQVCAFVNQRRAGRAIEEMKIPVFDVLTPGTLYLTAASSHLYDRDLEPAKAVMKEQYNPIGKNAVVDSAQPTPPELFYHVADLDVALRQVMDGSATRLQRWWKP